MPTNVKSWTKVLITASGADQDYANQDFLYKIKTEMLSHGWAHTSSCDSTATSSSSDLWTAANKLVWGSGSNIHSWIVLQNNSISTGLQILLDLNYVFTTSEYINIWFSFSGFSGGSTTIRPTATDEIRVNDVDNTWGGHSSGTTRSCNYLVSSDNQCHRIFTYGVSARRGYWWIDKIQNFPSWWTTPVAITVRSTDTTYANWSTTSGTFKTIISGADTYLTGLLPLIGSTNIGVWSNMNSGDVNGDYLAFPILLVSTQERRLGMYGSLFDVWFTEDGLADLDYFPNDGSYFQVILGDIAIGNSGTVWSWS
jgi:hypothetical protein